MTNFDNIPNELKQHKSWVCVVDDLKIPFQCNGNAASVSRPETWNTFEDVSKIKVPYIGYMFSGNGIVGIDIDDGFDDGFLNDLARDCMNLLQSYTEVSRSGRGIHILVKGKLPFDGSNNRKGVEIYQTGRYFITTGRRLIYHDIVENQEGIDAIIEKYFKESFDIETSSTKRIFEPTWSDVRRDRVPLEPEFDTLGKGERNISLISYGGLLRNSGYNDREIYETLSRVNHKSCDPRLDDAEIRQIVKSVWRYK